MKKIFVICTLLFILTEILIGCTSEVRKTTLQRAYELLATNPDSSLSILGTVDRNVLSEKTEAFYALLYVMAQDKVGLDVDHDSLIGIAFNFYKGREADSMYAKCLHYMGCYYYLNDSNKQAEDCFTKAIHVAKENKDYYTSYLALERLSKTLERNNLESAILCSKEAYQLFIDHFDNNLYNKVYLLLGIGNNYNLMSMYDSAQIYLNMALHHAKESQNQELQSSAYQSMSSLFQKRGQKDSALFYAKEAWNSAPVRNNSLALKLAYCYIFTDSLDQSILLLQQVCKAKSMYTRKAAFQLLTECAFRTDNLSMAWECCDSTLSLYSKEYEAALKDRSEYSKAHIEQIEKLERLKRDKDKHKYLFLVLTLSLIFTLLLIVSLHRNRTLKQKKELELEQVRHKTEEEKQHLIVFQREEQIKQLKKYIVSKVGLEDEMKQLMGNQTTVEINEDSWKDIEQFLNITGDDFAVKLHERHPDLSQEDLRFCMLVRMNFSIKELGNIYKLTDGSIKQKQNRFKKKLGIEDPTQSLRKYLHTL